MSDLAELRNISLDFRRLSSNFLNTKYEDGFLHLKRLNSYIHEQPKIQGIIDSLTAESDYFYEQFIVIDRFNRKQVNVPVSEADHIKAIYIYLGELATNHDDNLLHIAHELGFFNKKFDDSIRKFLEKMFKPLIDFIVDSISKEIMLLDSHQTVPQYNQHIENNFGTANVGTTITSSNAISQNDLNEVLKLLLVLELEIKSSVLEEIRKDSVLDDLETIREQIESDTPKKIRLEKAYNSLKDFVVYVASGVTAKVITSPTFLGNANILLERLQQLLSNIR